MYFTLFPAAVSDNPQILYIKMLHILYIVQIS
jgi:hypothetical protein